MSEEADRHHDHPFLQLSAEQFAVCFLQSTLAELKVQRISAEKNDIIMIIID